MSRWKIAIVVSVVSAAVEEAAVRIWRSCVCGCCCLATNGIFMHSNHKFNIVLIILPSALRFKWLNCGYNGNTFSTSLPVCVCMQFVNLSRSAKSKCWSAQCLNELKKTKREIESSFGRWSTAVWTKKPNWIAMYLEVSLANGQRVHQFTHYYIVNQIQMWWFSCFDTHRLLHYVRTS